MSQKQLDRLTAHAVATYEALDAEVRERVEAAAARSRLTPRLEFAPAA
jgi:hypothetical protein